MTSEERVSIMLKTRGYVVLGTMIQKPIGHRVDLIAGKLGGAIPALVITEETDVQDAHIQQQILKANNLTNNDEKLYPFSYFYKLVKGE